MKKVDVWYCVSFGDGDSDDWQTCTVEVTEAEYEKLRELIGDPDEDPDTDPVTEPVLERAREELLPRLTRELEENGDEYTLECLEEGDSPFDGAYTLFVTFEEMDEY